MTTIEKVTETKNEFLSTTDFARTVDKSLTGSFKTAISVWFEDHADENKTIVLVTITTEYYTTDSISLPVINTTHFEVIPFAYFQDITSFGNGQHFTKMVAAARQHNIKFCQNWCDESSLSYPKFPTTNPIDIFSELQNLKFFLKDPASLKTS